MMDIEISYPIKAEENKFQDVVENEKYLKK